MTSLAENKDKAASQPLLNMKIGGRVFPMFVLAIFHEPQKAFLSLSSVQVSFLGVFMLLYQELLDPL